MSILFALDSSGKTASVCLMQGGDILHEELLNEGLTHSETLLTLVRHAFDFCHLTPADVSVFALTVGPGSFTGLRIGLALAKGLAFPHNTPLVPISTLEAMALSTRQSGTVLSAINARRGEVYWAAFSLSDTAVRLTPDAAAPATQATDFIQKQQNSVFMVGDGAKLCYNHDNFSGKVFFAEATPLIAHGAALAATRELLTGKAISAEAARPIYLRLSQAERERLERVRP